MKTPKLLSRFLLLAALALPAAIASACSVTHVNSAAEITEKAETIVRAQAVGYEKENEFGGKVTFKILEVVKGDFKPETLTLKGQTENYSGPNDGKAPYNSVRPGGRRGSCYAQDYKMNGEFLLFLRGGSPYWSPLAAVNEEVSGENDPWVWWVKGYLSAAPKVSAPEAK